ncbi:MAG TPA: hypothetical protein VKU38_18985, partial [Ktedonobacteraceae bacterium]|nr:hypothetical protein [Ktedonobacteraceae bacterium]
IAHAKDRRFSAIHINDYEILLRMAHADKEGKYFRPAKYANGFDVCKFEILDVALTRLGEEASKYIRKVELIIIEFARDDYRKALKQFNPQFIQDAYFLYIDTDIDTCISRIYERAAHPKTPDDHFVSDTIVREYYGKDNRPYMVKNFRHEYHVPAERLWIIDNMRQLEDFQREVNHIAYTLLQLKTRILPETDPLQPVFKPVNECKASF